MISDVIDMKYGSGQGCSEYSMITKFIISETLGGITTCWLISDVWTLGLLPVPLLIKKRVEFFRI